MALLQEAGDHALKRPWLLAPPLLALLGQNMALLLSSGAPGSAAVQTVLNAAMTAAATALFAHLWLNDGWSLDGKRFLDTWALYLIPYPVLLAFGLATAPLVYLMLRADAPGNLSTPVVYLVVTAVKFAAFALGAASSIAAARRDDASGALGALKLGARALRKNGLFFAALLGCTWLFQELGVFLARSLAPGLLAGIITTAVPLIGCVALPIEAWRTGRLAA